VAAAGRAGRRALEDTPSPEWRSSEQDSPADTPSLLHTPRLSECEDVSE
jgi:hypothetical protein